MRTGGEGDGKNGNQISAAAGGNKTAPRHQLADDCAVVISKQGDSPPARFLFTDALYQRTTGTQTDAKGGPVNQE